MKRKEEPRERQSDLTTGKSVLVLSLHWGHLGGGSGETLHRGQGTLVSSGFSKPPV